MYEEVEVYNPVLEYTRRDVKTTGLSKSYICEREKGLRTVANNYVHSIILASVQSI